MPEEQIQTDRFGLMDAYLMEVRSIGGFSGSPVFLQVSGPRVQPGGGIQTTMGGPPPNYLMGLMHGFFGAEPEETAGPEPHNPFQSGIAAVVPVEKVIEAMHHPKIEERLDKIKKEAKQRNSIIEASVDRQGESATDEYDAFEDLAGKLVRVPKSEIDAERAKTDG